MTAWPRILGIEDPKPLGDYVEYSPPGGVQTLVVFVPIDALAQVSNAVFEAAAGWIGNYRDRGFKRRRHRHRFALEGANPAVGRRGKLEKVREYRFETIVPATKVQAVVEAMKKGAPLRSAGLRRDQAFRLYKPVRIG